MSKIRMKLVKSILNKNQQPNFILLNKLVTWIKLRNSILL